MNDNELINIIINVLVKPQLKDAGIDNTPLQQGFQPTQQGVPTEKSLFLYKISDHRYGFPKRSDEYVPPPEGSPPDTPGKIIHTEIQIYETVFQMNALSTQDPKNTSQLTASDILNLAAYCLQSAVCVTALSERGIGISRIENVINPYFMDDRDRNEANPSLDFTINHKRIVSTTTPVLQSTQLQILTV